MKIKFTLLLVACIATLWASPVSAQFTNPVYPETIYPPMTPGATPIYQTVTRVPHSSCATIAGYQVSGSTCDLYVYGWGRNTDAAGIAWRRTAPGHPTTILDENYIAFPHSNPGNTQYTFSDVEVGMYTTGTETYVVVAYHKKIVPVGSAITGGHFLETYKWTLTGLVLMSSMQLSTTPDYGGISLDFHNGYGVVVVWQEPNVGLKTMAGVLNGGSIVYGNILSIPNTSQAIAPDVAYCHASATSYSVSGLVVHYAYYDMAQSAIVEAAADFFDLQTVPGPSFPLIVEDINNTPYVSPAGYDYGTSFPLCLDGPDHYQDDNWAYIYTDGSARMYTRVMTRNVSTSASTYILNDGSLGNVNMINSTAYSTVPVLAYDNTSMGFYAGWYAGSTTPFASKGNLAVHLKDNGTLVNSNYMLVLQSNIGGDMSSIMAFSKQNDQSNYLFVVTPYIDVPSGSHYLINKYIPWFSTSFKSVNENPIIFNSILSVSGVLAPNPFSGNNPVKLSPNMLEQNNIEVNVTNIMGAVILQTTGDYETVNASFARMATLIPTGVYNVSIKGDDGRIITNKIIKQ